MSDKPEGAEPIRDATRTEPGPRRRVAPLVTAFAVLVSLAHIWWNTLSTMSELYVSAMHFGGLAMIGAMTIPLMQASTAAGRRVVFGIDLVLGLLALLCAAYLPLMEEALYDRGQDFIWSDWVVSILTILLAIEFVRRTTGWIIPALIILSLTYVAWWGRYAPGVFHFPGLSWEIVLYRSYYTTGLFGTIARISATYVFMFILFGAFLVRSGAGAFIIDLARAAAGRFVGGPGLVAVLGSGLMGSISGSAVANTVSTGVITIPLMKKAGFPARFAAGVEATASTGGQLMPPIMGAGVFIMSSYTLISYLDIIAVSFLPAVMYFLSVAAWVRIEAKKRGVHAVEEETPPILDVLKRGAHSLIPIAILIALLIWGFTPTYAAAISIAAVIASSWLGANPMGPRAILDALELGAKNMVTTGVLLVAVGVMVEAFATTGTGNTISLMIKDWAGGSLVVTMILVALASLILGMGLPVTASYIVLATLSAPALYDLIAESQLIDMIAAGTLPEEARAIFMLTAPEVAATLGQGMSVEAARELLAGVPPDFAGQLLEQALSPAVLSTALLSAHMIIFWLSQDSNVTPPVCLTAFAAAAIAGTPAMATGLTAWKIAKGLYIIPVLFAYTPFLGGDFFLSLWIFAFGSVGIYALTGAISGWMEYKLSWIERGLLAATGVALLWPTGPTVNVPGFVFFLCLFAFNLYTGRRRHAAREGSRMTAAS